jgi:predicted Zn-dependent protease
MQRRPLILLLLALAACTTPTTQAPTYSKAELEAEQQAQAAAAKQGNSYKAQDTYSSEELAALTERLDPIAARIASSATQLCHDMRGANAKCDYKVILDTKEKGLNAYADGQNVVINPAMVAFATNNTHLAFVIAHEFGHNIMGHIKAQQQNTNIGGLLGGVVDIAAGSRGYDTSGAFGQIGAQQALLRYSPAFEQEADYVGMYILARAGYAIEETPEFWRLMSQTEPRSIYVTSTHPNNPSRTIEMEKTVTEIRAKQQNGQPLLPNIRPKA